MKNVICLFITINSILVTSASFAAFPLPKTNTNNSGRVTSNKHPAQHDINSIEKLSPISSPINNSGFLNKYIPYGHGPDGMVSGALSLTFGILSIVASYAGIGLIFAVPALVFGIVGSCRGNGTAIAGLVLGAIGLVLGLIWLSVFGLWFL